MVRIQWIMKPFPGQNDQAMENVKKFAKLWKDQGANKCTIAIMSGNMWGHISFNCNFDNFEHLGKTRDLVRSHSDLKLMINDGSKLGEIVQEKHVQYNWKLLKLYIKNYRVGIKCH